MVVDTEKVMGGAPMRTTFHLSTHLFELEHPILLLEGGVHKPSPADTLAPFYQDPAQRIGALLLSVGVVVFRVGALLELLESHEGSEIGWDEWKDHVVATPQAIEYGMSDITCTWVSGCRLFSISPGLDAEMELVDFSIQRHVKYLSEQVDADLCGVRHMLPSDARAQVSWFGPDNIHTGHDSIVLSNWLPDWTRDGTAEHKYVFHIWTF